MSSRFNPAVMPKMSNPVCNKTVDPDAVIEIDSVPAALIVACWWTDFFLAPPLQTATMLVLIYDQATKTWSIAIPTGIYKLRVIITRLAAPDQYDVLLELYSNGVMIDDDSWHDVYIDPGPPLRSMKFEHLWAPGADYNGVHVLS